MTRPHDDHVPSAGTGERLREQVAALDAEHAARIRAELAALGEDPADDEELAFAAAPTAAPDDVRTVATLVGLATWAAPEEGLLPLERHRVWQRVASRMPSGGTGRAAHGIVAHEPAANDGGGLRGIVASLALVAGVALLLHVDVPPPPTAEDRALLESTSEAARAALEVMAPGEQDGARARSLADGYAERLSAARGAER